MPTASTRKNSPSRNGLLITVGQMWEVNFFSSVCPSLTFFVRGGGGMWLSSIMYWISQCGDPPGLAPTYAPPRYWHLVPKTGGLFKFVHLRTPTPISADIWWLMQHIVLHASWYPCCRPNRRYRRGKTDHEFTRGVTTGGRGKDDNLF